MAHAHDSYCLPVNMQDQSSRPLKIILTNACSIISKLAETTLLIGKEAPLIAAITETWLHDDISDAEICIPGYISYRCDRHHKRRGGGVLIYAHNSLRTESLPIEITNPPLGFEIIACKWNLAGQDFSLILVYRSPSCSSTDDHLLLDSIKPHISGSHECIILGDFNAPSIDWEAMWYPSVNSFQSELVKFAEENFLFQMVTDPTRFRNGQRSSILDLIFVKFPDLLTSTTTLPPLAKSDHAVVAATLSSHSPADEKNPPIFCYPRLRTEQLLAIASQVDWICIEELDNVEEMWQRFKSEVLRLTYISVPTSMPSSTKDPPWLARLVKTTMSLRTQAWRSYREIGTSAAFGVYKRYRNRTFYALRHSGRFHEARIAVAAKHNPKPFFPVRFQAGASPLS